MDEMGADVVLGRVVEVVEVPVSRVDPISRITVSGALQHFGVEQARVFYSLQGSCVDGLEVCEDVLVFGVSIGLPLGCEQVALRTAWEQDGRDFDGFAHALGFTTEPIGLREAPAGCR